jgi:RNA-directed DNA polymerase
VVAAELERKVELIFHPDSYGYRPNRSALDAVATCRRRCWKTDWVIDLDIQKFFDSVPWELMIKAVEANTDLPWVVLYVRRWLHAPLQLPEGTLRQRDRGTPQGGLCAAAHNAPYEQRWIMCSAGPFLLVRRAAAVERRA